MSAYRNLLLTLIVLQTATLGLLLFNTFDTPRNADAHRVSVTGNGTATSELKNELRAIVRSEIAALGPTAAAPAAPDLPAETAAMLSESEQEQRAQAFAASSFVIRQAVTAGVWTGADSQALLQHIGGISSEQRLELAEEFYAAVNRQELKLKDFPPL